MSTKAFVLGLDGIPWELISRWTDDGKLPNFGQLRKEGAAGPLTSTIPPTTALAWPSIATGVQPDKHGIYGFQNLSDNYRHQMHTSRDVRHPELWDIVSPSIVANVPMTYPASPIEGTMVTGMLTPKISERMTHPPEFHRELLDKIPHYQISLKWGEYTDRREEFLEDLADLVSARRALMRLLMERTDWRLFFFVYTAPDRLQHLLWDEETLLDHYKELDDILGEVREYVGQQGGNLFVVSDHGFGPIDGLVNVNRLLEQHGYLVRRELSGTRSLLAGIGINRKRVQQGLNRIGIDETAVTTHLPRKFVDSVAEQLPGNHSLYDVNYSQTTAFVHESGMVYVNDSDRFEDGHVAPADVPEIKQSLVELFSSVTTPDSNLPALEVVDGEDLFPNDDRAPDLVVLGINGYRARTGLVDTLFTDAGELAGDHLPDGIFMAWGPDIESGTTVRNSTVVDVAPTVLKSLGEPLPESIDGRVLDEIFARESLAARTPTETRSYTTAATTELVDDEFEDVEERLRGLGYLDG